MRYDLPIVICGAGKNCRCALHYIRKHNENAEITISDRDMRKWGKKVEETSIVSLDSIPELYGENALYLLAGVNAEEIATELSKYLSTNAQFPEGISDNKVNSLTTQLNKL